MASVSEQLRKKVYGSANPSQSQINAVREKANTLAPGAQEALDRHTQAATSVQPASSKPSEPFWKTWFLDKSTNDQVVDSTTGQVIQVDKPSAAGLTGKGAAKGSAAGFTSVGSTILSALNKSIDTAENYSSDFAERQVRSIQKSLAEGKTSDGKILTPKMRETLLQSLSKYQTQAQEGPTDSFEERHPVLSSVQKSVESTADSLKKSSDADIAQAKEDLGALGQFAVDAGVAGTQLAGDVGLALLTGGSALVPMAVRGFGSGAQEARQSGADLGNQLTYGAASAALSAATEQISNVAAPFRRVFGQGVADKLAGKLVSRFGENAAVQAMNKLTQTTAGRLAASALGEGSEEFVEDVFQPVLQRATYDPDARFDMGQALYDAAIGATLGGVAGGVDLAMRSNAMQGANTSPVETTEEPARANAQQDASAQQASSETPVLDAAQKIQAQQQTAETTAPSTSPTVEAPADPLLQAILNGKRVDQTQASNAQFDAMAERGDIGVDASGKLYQMRPEEHIDQRSQESARARGVNAFQYDHPELQQYMKQAAESLIADADLSLQFPMTRSYSRGAQGNQVNQSAQTSASLREAMDQTGLSRAEIIDAANRIINDQGQENVAAAKAVELILDDMLSNGYTTMYGDTVAPNTAYVNAKQSIEGAAPVSEQSGENLPIWDMGGSSDGLGAADAGSLNSVYQNLQAQSTRFYPEGANAARPVDVPTTNFEGRNIPKAASTIMGAQGIDDSDVRFLEQQIADGKLAFDTIRDTEAVARAQAVMQEKGFDGAMEQYRQAVAGNVAAKDNTALGQQLLLRAMKEGNTAYVAELLTLYTRNSTTVAQAMQAQSIFRKLSPEGQLVAVQKAVADLNAKYGTDVQLSEEEVSDFLNAETPEARQKVTERIVERAAESVPGTFRAKYDTLRYLAMLGNPRTHIRNILGNTFFQLPVALKNRVGAVAESIAHVASGGKTERTKALFGVNPLGKLAAEARADWSNAKDFLEQTSKYMEGQTSLWNIEQKADAFSNSNILGRSVNKAADLNSRALAAEDTAAKKWIYTQSLAGYLKANGCKSIADADIALLNRARNYAAQEALRGTFNDSNEISNAVSSLGRASKSNNKAVKAAGYVVEGVLPFKRTPANIAVRAVEYSPIGAVLGAVETMRGAKSGDMSRVSVGLDRIAAGVSGTALLAAGFLAAGAGYVTGGEDEDEKQQDFNDLTGHQNYALELKNGTSVTLDWLAPEAIPFFMGVELYNSMLDGGVSWDEAWETVKNAASPMLEMSMLQGLNDTLENAAYAQNRGDSVLGALVTSALTNYATQIVPTLGGQLERSGENVRMSTYTEKDGILPTDFQYTLGKVSQKIPGWDYQQIPYIDAWGRTESNGDPILNAANNFLNPAYTSQVEVDAVEAELQKVRDETGDTAVFPTTAQRYIEVDGERKDLTAEEYEKYARKLGTERYSLLQEAMQLPAYKGMSAQEKADYIADLYSYAGAVAKADVSSYQLDGWQKNASTAQRDIGVSPAEYIALYQKYGSSYMSGNGYEKTKEAVSKGFTVDEYVTAKTSANTNGKSGVNKEEATSYVNQSGLTGQKKVDLWDLICTTSDNNPFR